MKADLDRIMAERNLDALLVMGDAGGNKVMNYLTGGAPLENALVIKRRGGPLTLVHGSMERDTALATGLDLVDRDQRYNRYELLKKHNGDRLAAEVDYLAQVLADQGIDGRLGIYGMQDAGATFAVLTQLQQVATNVELVGEFEESLFSLARETKDDEEIAEMREAGRLTTLIMGETRDFIQEHNVRDEVVMKDGKTPLTIGDVRRFIHGRLNHYGMAEDHDTIFAQGRDAGVPHNRGDDNAPLRLGQPIVFDFFPMTGKGYFHDVAAHLVFGLCAADSARVWDQCKGDL
ncbi:MAG: aminopeptidase P family N-terminal domain-containing protein [Caldilineaceae bacterium]